MRGAGVPFALEEPWLAALLILVFGTLAVLLARRSFAEGSRARHRLSLACRLALLVLLALAVAGLAWRRPRPEVSVAFVVDSSDSVRGSKEEALRILEQAAAHAKPSDRVAIVQFGRDALVERRLGEDLGDLALSSVPQPDGSDVASALRLARALLPAEGRRRVVLLTDGAASGEDPAGAVRTLREAGLDVVLMPLGVQAGPEVLVDDISAPERVHEGEPFEVRVVLRASVASPGRLTITRDGALLGEADVDVEAGAPAAFRFVDRAGEAGAHLYRAHFDTEDDGFEQNDAAETLVRVEGRPKVLLVDPDPARLAPFSALLEAAGIESVAVLPERVPRSVAEASRHAAIVLSDVDSLNLQTRQMQAIASYVREAGGGLLMAGGPESFGPGGWYRTPIEDVLPVDMDVQNEKYYPSLALVVAIDKSGSMAGTDGESKLDLAKEAAMQTAALLHPTDRLGVIAFDSAAKVVVDPGEPFDAGAAVARIGTIRPGGGTDIYVSLVVAEERLAKAGTALKHCIVLSDGQSPGRDYQAILERMHAAGITTSTVAVGADADLASMQQFATWGGGRYYFTDDPGSVPRIFTKEAFTTARSFVVEESFAPVPASPHAILRGALPLPTIDGYVATTPKPVAEVLLRTHREDPLLVVRSFGLGRSAALTTDLGQRWSSAWLASEQGRTLFAQLIRWVAARSESPLLTTRLERKGGRVVVSVEARDEAGAFLNFADLRTSVSGPSGVPAEARLRQVAPGRYEAELPDAGPGAWFAAVTQHDGERIVRASGAAVAFPYSDEYRSLRPAADALEGLALASGARVEHDPATLFERTGAAASSLRPAWRDLVLAAALLLLLDVALRRVMLPEGWLAAVRRRLARQPATPDAPEPLSRLRAAKSRVRDEADADSRERPPAPAVAVRAPPVAAPSPLPTPGPAAEEEGDDFGSRLLAAKRRARSDKLPR